MFKKFFLFGFTLLLVVSVAREAKATVFSFQDLNIYSDVINAGDLISIKTSFDDQTGLLSFESKSKKNGTIVPDSFGLMINNGLSNITSGQIQYAFLYGETATNKLSAYVYLPKFTLHNTWYYSEYIDTFDGLINYSNNGTEWVTSFVLDTNFINNTFYPSITPHTLGYQIFWEGIQFDETIGFLYYPTDTAYNYTYDANSKLTFMKNSSVSSYYIANAKTQATQPVPEPATLGMFGLALGMLTSKKLYSKKK